MKTTIPLFSIVLAFLSVTGLPTARAVCQEGCSADNTFLGEDALVNNVSNENTAVGYHALFNNIGGSFNTAHGTQALENNTGGSQNTAVGVIALLGNTTGSNNTAIGFDALTNDPTGSNNIALGVAAGLNVFTGSNDILIGNVGGAHDDNVIRIGTKGTHRNTIIAGISGATVPTGVPVIVDNNAHLGTTTSSARYKDNIKPMDKASEAILALKPVSFRYKHELDPNGIPQFGLVAEEVENVNPDLVARDEQGKPYTVRYEAVNAMLLNEFLKEHRKVEELTKQFQAANAQHQKQIEALTAGLQKVSAQLEASRTAPQVVNNP
ncbi:MAG: hypothetical protein DMF00_13255 [Verrucomicrobia bacterium]|nr:MAG: hypothetical protein DMF00_13255 [Verrucomicrobiota bacterium]